MKKTAFILALLTAISIRAETNVYLNVSDAELIRRIGVITNLEARLPPVEGAAATNSAAHGALVTNLQTAVYSAGLADIGFVTNQISAGFTNANFASVDLAPYVGTNQALVLMRFQAVAASTVSVRVPGDTNTVDDTSMNSVAIAAGSSAYMICDTSTNGVVEVKATANTSMNLIAFIRRHVFE